MTMMMVMLHERSLTAFLLQVVPALQRANVQSSASRAVQHSIVWRYALTGAARALSLTWVA